MYEKLLLITQPGTEMKVTPDFSEENTTQGDGYIHAWGRGKAIEYLKKIKEELACVQNMT